LKKVLVSFKSTETEGLHGQECYQTLNSGCNRHLMADVALPDHFCFLKDIKNKKIHLCELNQEQINQWNITKR